MKIDINRVFKHCTKLYTEGLGDLLNTLTSKVGFINPYPAGIGSSYPLPLI